ncbi:MAG: helix-turn-helix transcriptional regulator [Ruminococcaceae bacterium]|nr:helix-turn-helix transcriptional regulator [Oscillospiraceae bacterium]
MNYVKTSLQSTVEIKSVISFHYFEYCKKYSFKGEKHNFWEIVYADKGDINVIDANNEYKLTQGSLILHAPNVFHNVIASQTEGSNTIIFSFDSDSEILNSLAGKVIKISVAHKKILAKIVDEGINAFTPPYNDPNQKKLCKRDDISLGAEQLFKIYIEELIISLLRMQNSGDVISHGTSSAKSEELLAVKIEEYLKANVYSSLCFEDVCYRFSRSKTSVKTAFSKHTGKGVMEYYNLLKIEEAKKLIRNETLNFTEISNLLSFNSVHYFSRHFKKHTGMTPTQYLNSVKAMSRI